MSEYPTPLVFRGTDEQVEEYLREFEARWTAPRSGWYRLKFGKEEIVGEKLRRPTVGQVVHYVSFGTPGGEYTAQCRAAIVAEVGQWVTVETTTPKSFDRSEGRPIREVEQWWYDDACQLVVHNPTGLFFNGAAGVACKYDEGAGQPGDGTCVDHLAPGFPLRYCACGWTEPGYRGGTWHYADHGTTAS